jgi:hypothetical protein
MTYAEDKICLVDVVTGSVAVLAPGDEQWHVREGGPVKLWQKIEQLLDAYDDAGRPGPDAFTLHTTSKSQYLHHPKMPRLQLPQP